MSARLAISALALGAAILAGGTAAFIARASDHPRTEPSVAAQCADCHLTDYRRARHHAGEKPTTCGVCHTQSHWHERHFEHPFALTGAHERAKCFDCHRGEPATFHGTSNACIDCHREEYERAPHHVGHFATTCEDCHTFDAWKPTKPHEWNPPEPPEPPPPPPSVTASTPPPPPPPTITAKPKPKPPKPKPTATGTTTTKPPDIIVHPSQMEHEEGPSR